MWFAQTTDKLSATSMSFPKNNSKFIAEKMIFPKTTNTLCKEWVSKQPANSWWKKIFPNNQQIHYDFSLKTSQFHCRNASPGRRTRELADATTFQDFLELHSAGLQVVWPRGMGPTDVKKMVEDARRRGLV